MHAGRLTGPHAVATTAGASDEDPLQVGALASLDLADVTVRALGLGARVQDVSHWRAALPAHALEARKVTDTETLARKDDAS